jgi:hypothetical protein
VRFSKGFSKVAFLAAIAKPIAKGALRMLGRDGLTQATNAMSLASDTKTNLDKINQASQR